MGLASRLVIRDGPVAPDDPGDVLSGSPRRPARAAVVLLAAIVSVGQAVSVAAGEPVLPAPRSVTPGSVVPEGTPYAGTITPGTHAAEMQPVVEPVGIPTVGIQYEDALAHADDPNPFVPGARVDIPFRPRGVDTWPVDGRAPRALPAGNASGHEMVRNAQGRTWAVSAPGAVASPGAPASPGTDNPVSDDPVDGPIADPADVQPADSTAAWQFAPSDVAEAQATGLQREVFGFLPYWELSSSSTTYRYDLLSTIAYFSVGADRNGNLIKQNSDGSTSTGWGGWTSSKLTTVINNAHAKGTRVVLTITSFAWTSGGATNQAALLGSTTARLRLAQQAAAAVRDRGADGINLDFEPIASGYADEFTALVRTMRSELNKIAPGYQLTFDTTGYIGNYPIEDATAPGGADAIFIMGYDYRTSSASTAGSIAPLGGPAYDLLETIAAYRARVPASKLILGVPYYGRAWSTETDKVRSKNISGTKYGTSATALYETAIGLAAEHGRRWDATEKTPWTVYRKETCTTTYGCVTSWRQLYYDDAQSLAAKYDTINLQGLRGAGIWALGYDGTRTELWNVLRDKFQRDETAPLAGISPLPAAQTSETFTVHWTGVDDRGIASWDVDVSIDGGAWLSWLRATTLGSSPYVGADGHGFAFRVRARDAAGNNGAWGPAGTWTASPTLKIGGFGRVVASSLNVRSGPTTGASVVTTASSDTVLAIEGGPVSADGYTWWKVALPVEEWPSIGILTNDVWVASGSSTTTLVAATAAPNTTFVNLAGAPAAGARFVGLTPARVLDSRIGTGLSGPFTTSTVRTFSVAGKGGVPTNAIAVTGNLTVTGQTSAGYVALGPTMTASPSTSSLNAPKGDTRAVGVMLALSGSGSLSAVWKGASGSSAQLVFDVTGYFVPGSTGATFVPVDPVRLLDTRSGNGLAGTFRESVVRTVAIAGRGGIPANAVAVTGNATVTGQTSAGYIAVGPAMTATPDTSTLNVARGDNRANAVAVMLSGAGSLSAVWRGSSNSTAHVVFDVTGYFTTGAGGATFHPVAPVRLLDTRVANGLSAALGSRAAKAFATSGRGTVPFDALAVSGTLTVTGQRSAGYLAIGPSMGSSPTTSTLNAPGGDNRANGFVARMGPLGALGIVWVGGSSSTAHAIVDVTGYFR